MFWCIFTYIIYKNSTSTHGWLTGFKINSLDELVLVKLRCTGGEFTYSVKLQQQHEWPQVRQRYIAIGDKNIHKMGLLLWVWLGLQQDSVSQYSSSSFSLQESQSHSERLHRHMSLFFGWACAVQSNFSSQKPATDRWIRKIVKIKALKWKRTPDTLQFVFPFTKDFLNCDQCKNLLIQLINKRQ